MTEEKIKSDNELRMYELCSSLKFQTAQLDKARKSHISTEIAINNLNRVAASLEGTVKELERKGFKRVEIPDAVIETPAPQLIPPGGN